MRGEAKCVKDREKKDERDLRMCQKEGTEAAPQKGGGWKQRECLQNVWIQKTPGRNKVLVLVQLRNRVYLFKEQRGTGRGVQRCCDVC